MPRATIIRVQDASGRGPWRPGFPKVWVTDHTPLGGRSISQERGIERAIAKALRMGLLHVGCAVRADKIGVWFTPDDISRLTRLGYRMVDASACQILMGTDQQVLIGSKFPLKFLPSYVSDEEVS